MHKKLIAFVPVWFLYYTGEFFGNWDCTYDNIWAYNMFEKCMSRMQQLQTWANLKQPQI